MPTELYDVLASPHVLKIGQCLGTTKIQANHLHALDSGDNERLNAEFFIRLTNSADIALLAKRKGLKKTNLKEQTKVLLGIIRIELC